MPIRLLWAPHAHVHNEYYALWPSYLQPIGNIMTITNRHIGSHLDNHIYKNLASIYPRLNISDRFYAINRSNVSLSSGSSFSSKPSVRRCIDSCKISHAVLQMSKPTTIAATTSSHGMPNWEPIIPTAHRY